ncbi:MAG: type II toxin-antitoxin system VapB family antitoxin [Cardiobacteriaceae bacterium]|nr:type II toxin-antitoxin system VapB family antitoxin [Cardiobacteriaceae bacterium]
MSEATIFMTNRTQAVRLPADVRFAEHVKKVHVRVVGEERILTPVDHLWDSFFFGSRSASEDFMSERENAIQPEREPW